ncbi:MAG: DEAD/DEAH box helicase, partial [Actinomycetes bacterium]
LAQDQLTTFTGWRMPWVTAGTYDGDCSVDERAVVRRHANVVLTNPDMLHHGILPQHRRWESFLRRLELVVVDELHVLRGVFGTHTAQVLRRLQRLVHHHGGPDLRFVMTSATIGDPAGLAQALCGQQVTAVDQDGSPAGRRSVVLWDPTEAPVGTSTSAPAAAGRIAADMALGGLRTLVFCRSRRSTELVANDLRTHLGPELEHTVRSYRSGYLPEERRQIEDELFDGRLRAVVATSALELGVDIGGLDAVVLCGFPGTVASFWQQMGRAGREQQHSLAVLVAGDDQLDRYMVRHPDELFGRAPEPAVVNNANPYVVVPHLGCAAAEVPLRHDDERWWPDLLDEGIAELVQTDRGTLRSGSDGPEVVWTGRGSPASAIGLRSASRGEYRVVDHAHRTIGTVDEARLHEVLHPDAVYLHQGRAWRVTDLQPVARVARVEPADGTTYTQAMSSIDISVLGTDAERPVGRAVLHLGRVEVTTQVTGYREVSLAGHRVLSRHELDLPAAQLRTTAVWWTFDQELVDDAGVSEQLLPGALHAAEHAAIGILPLFTICDRWDVGGVSIAWTPDTGAATVFIHDGYPGGAGIADLAFGADERHLAATLEVLVTCPCENGCPSCVQSPKCGNGNDPLEKGAATTLLQATLG